MNLQAKVFRNFFSLREMVLEVGVAGIGYTDVTKEKDGYENDEE